jgi:hypothetical protein
MYKFNSNIVDNVANWDLRGLCSSDISSKFRSYYIQIHNSTYSKVEAVINKIDHDIDKDVFNEIKSNSKFEFKKFLLPIRR